MKRALWSDTPHTRRGRRLRCCVCGALLTRHTLRRIEAGGVCYCATCISNAQDGASPARREAVTA
jgi:hypothetical protein